MTAVDFKHNIAELQTRSAEDSYKDAPIHKRIQIQSKRFLIRNRNASSILKLFSGVVAVIAISLLVVRCLRHIKSNHYNEKSNRRLAAALDETGCAPNAQYEEWKSMISRQCDDILASETYDPALNESEKATVKAKRTFIVSVLVRPIIDQGDGTKILSRANDLLAHARSFETRYGVQLHALKQILEGIIRGHQVTITHRSRFMEPLANAIINQNEAMQREDAELFQDGEQIILNLVKSSNERLTCREQVDLWQRVLRLPDTTLLRTNLTLSPSRILSDAQ